MVFKRFRNAVVGVILAGLSTIVACDEQESPYAYRYVSSTNNKARLEQCLDDYFNKNSDTVDQSQYRIFQEKIRYLPGYGKDVWVHGACEPNVYDCYDGQLILEREGTAPSIELCDDKDNDCDGKIDNNAICPDGQGCKEGACIGLEHCIDFDWDGYVNLDSNCRVPDGKLLGDCDKFDSTVYPDAQELCDNKDNDCDGLVDEELTLERICYTDNCKEIKQESKCINGEQQKFPYCQIYDGPGLQACSSIETIAVRGKGLCNSFDADSNHLVYTTGHASLQGWLSGSDKCQLHAYDFNNGAVIDRFPSRASEYYWNAATDAIQPKISGNQISFLSRQYTSEADILVYSFSDRDFYSILRGIDNSQFQAILDSGIEILPLSHNLNGNYGLVSRLMGQEEDVFTEGFYPYDFENQLLVNLSVGDGLPTPLVPGYSLNKQLCGSGYNSYIALQACEEPSARNLSKDNDFGYCTRESSQIWLYDLVPTRDHPEATAFESTRTLANASLSKQGHSCDDSTLVYVEENPDSSIRIFDYETGLDTEIVNSGFPPELIKNPRNPSINWRTLAYQAEICDSGIERVFYHHLTTGETRIVNPTYDFPTNHDSLRIVRPARQENPITIGGKIVFTEGDEIKVCYLKP